MERDIVAGPADIDKLDYLLRDSHFCGVNYGRYDLDKLVESARLDGLFSICLLLGQHSDTVTARSVICFRDRSAAPVSVN